MIYHRWATGSAHNLRSGVGITLTLALSWSCSSPTRPTPVVTPPSLSCPAPIALIASSNQSQSVVYAKPTLSGGTVPVTTTCTPSQGAMFPLGSSTVSCTAVDAQQRSASCAFSVSLQAPVSLKASALLAFGDSITEGKTGPALLPFTLTGVGCPNGLATGYPALLDAALRAQYPAQSIATRNCGWGGETAVEGVTRLPTGLVLAAFDVVTIMEGANDLSEVNHAGGSQATAVNRVSNAIVSMIRTARTGRTVFVATLTPQRSGGKTASRPDWVQPVNDRLRSVVPLEGAVLVDVHQAFGGSPDPYIDADGLHPTVAGHQKIAETFLTAIKARLEIKAGG